MTGRVTGTQTRVRVSKELYDERCRLAQWGLSAGRWPSIVAEMGEALAPVVRLEGDERVLWIQFLDRMSASPIARRLLTEELDDGETSQIRKPPWLRRSTC